MNFKPTKWKVIVSILFLIFIRLIIFYSGDNDANLVVTTGPSIFVYLIWSLFEKKKSHS